MSYTLIIDKFVLRGSDVCNTIALNYKFNGDNFMAKINPPIIKGYITETNVCGICVSNRHIIDDIEKRVVVSGVVAYKWDLFDKARMIEIQVESASILWYVVKN